MLIAIVREPLSSFDDYSGDVVFEWQISVKGNSQESQWLHSFKLLVSNLDSRHVYVHCMVFEGAL